MAIAVGVFYFQIRKINVSNVLTVDFSHEIFIELKGGSGLESPKIGDF